MSENTPLENTKRRPVKGAVKKAVKTAVQKAKQAPNTVTSNRLELLVTVVGRSKAEYYEDLILSFDVNMQVTALASGTANEKMLSLLGLSDNEKSVIFSVIQQEKIPKAVRMLEEKFKTIKGGNGIAYTIPLSSLIGKLIFGFLSNNRTVQEENKALVELIRLQADRGIRYSQIAVLYRTNTQPGALIAKLMEYNLPFRTKERIPNLYEHWIARDIKAYFSLALGSRRREDFLRIMNRPKRYLSRESLAGMENVSFDAWMEFYKKQSWIAERIEKLQYDLQVLSRITPFAAVNFIRKSIGYDEYLTDYANSRQIPENELLETLDELMESTKEYKSLDEWLGFTQDYTEKLKREQQKQNQPETDSISVLTLHASKGLEYDIVIIPDVNEGLIPYKKAVLEAELEEERRMLYVGMTRTKKELFLSYVKNIRSRQAQPSVFLTELL